ncbi:MAG: DEAD/DEAH box helicase [Desulfobulbaceae bacterium]|nr:DEAD/DEAH box helicase [Desulfobulbaceae bacterium]
MVSFEELGVGGEILQGLDALGFTEPTPIQEKVIPALLKESRDVVGLAQTGTGKTAAFGIPLLQMCDPGAKKTQGLVLCPTRELCVQVARDMAAFGKFVKGVKVRAVYGGARIDLQIKELRQGAHIVVATPGRLHDLIRRKAVDISALRLVVLDEADEMLQMGFQDELNAILAQTPATKNTLLFSATMPATVSSISRKYMSDPMEITVGQRNAGSENIRHLCYMVHAKDRYAALRRIVDVNPEMYAIIFCRTRQEVKDVAGKLIQEGYSADTLHGELSQSQRDYVMNKFRSKSLQILVATDVAARGLDVNDLTHVINYNLPDDIANYTHRSGRTGRAGKTGVSVVIINMREKYLIRAIENKLKRKFEDTKVPSGADVCQIQLLKLIDTVKQVEVDEAKIEPFLAAITEKLASLDREELVKRFVSVEFNRFLSYYRNAPDLNVAAAPPAKGRYEKSAPQGKFAKREHQVPFTRFTLNVGKNDGMYATRLIGQVNESTGSSNIRIGRIDITDDSVTFEVDSAFAKAIPAVFDNLLINGKKVVAEIGKGKFTKPRVGPRSFKGKKPYKGGGKPPFKPGVKKGPWKKANKNS